MKDVVARVDLMNRAQDSCHIALLDTPSGFEVAIATAASGSKPEFTARVAAVRRIAAEAEFNDAVAEKTGDGYELAPGAGGPSLCMKLTLDQWHFVTIVRRGRPERVERCIGPYSEAAAAEYEADLNGTLNHADYYTRIDRERLEYGEAVLGDK